MLWILRRDRPTDALPDPGTDLLSGFGYLPMKTQSTPHGGWARRPGPARAHRALVLLGVAVLLGGCRTAIDPVSIQDAQTAAQVKTALINDPDLGAKTITVDVNQGVVRLSGMVASQAEADRATALVRAVPGVRDVQTNLQIGGTGTSSTNAPDPVPLPSVSEFDDGDPRLLAVGASVGWSRPRVGTLDSHLSVGPLFRLGSGRGFGPAFGLNWFQTTLAAVSPDADVISRINVRPFMAGISYTWASNRVSISPSLVGGMAFNSLTVPETGAADRVAVEVSNSLVWRPGASVWLDLNRHLAVNLTAGYVVTRLRVTFLEGGTLVKRDVPGDTTILHAGLAYKLF